MQKLLMPVDGSPNAERVVHYVAKLAGLGCPLDIHLLHVQPAITSWEIKRFRSVAEIESLQQAMAEEATRGACAILNEAGLAYTLRHEVGEVAETIAAYADAHGCDQIIMGARGMGALEGLLLGSVSTKVLHLVKVPVTLVK